MVITALALFFVYTSGYINYFGADEYRRIAYGIMPMFLLFVPLELFLLAPIVRLEWRFRNWLKARIHAFCDRLFSRFRIQ